MNNKNNVVLNSGGSGGIGFAGLLTIAFIVLKIAGIINWSWLWVLSPLWISAGLGLIICVIILIIAIITQL